MAANRLSPLGALLDALLAQHAVEARPALAHKAVDVVDARGAVVAGLAGTFIHLRRAPLALEARPAVTREVGDAVVAGAAVLARVWITDALLLL